MDERRFDRFAKTLADGASRRQVLGRFAGGAGGGLLGAIGFGKAGAQESRREREAREAREREEREREAREERERDERARRQPRATLAPAPAPAPAPTATAQPAPTTTPATQPLGAICRQDGESCGGDQLCCETLLCVPSGKDQATRCVSSEPVEACAETCEAEEVPVAKLRPYTVEVDCQYDDADDRTTCDCAGRGADPAAPPVRRVTLPQSDVCAEVVGGEFELLSPDRAPRRAGCARATGGNGGEANADASGGAVVVGDVDGGGETQITIDAGGGNASADASGGNNNVAIAGGGRAVRYASPGGVDRLRLSFAGRVTTGGTATYWCETENGLVPATGPSLVRDQAELDPGTGTIVVRAVACGVEQAAEGFDWYGQCRRPARARLRLRSREGGQSAERDTGATDDAGRRSFRGLAPGTYRVAPEGGDWCHAECDSANDNGDVLLAAGQRATVWLFSCAGRRS